MKALRESRSGGVGGPTGRRPARLAVALLATGLAGCGGSEEASPPPERPPVESRVERPEFSGDSAYALLERQVDFGPRVPGTEGHAAQLAWMLERLGAAADTVIEQSFSVTTTGGTPLDLTNVMARFQPEAERRILLLAHWDTRPTSDEAHNMLDRELPVPGANDGASGTAVLLHLAELFADEPPPLGVDLLLVDGEDYGPGTVDMFFGSEYFAAHLDQFDGGYAPLYGVLLDMVGDADPRFPVEGYSAEYAPGVVQKVWRVARDLGYSRYFPLETTIQIQDDHVPLNEAGLRTIVIIDFEYPAWHTPQDVPANTSPRTLGMVGEVVAELVYTGG